MNGRTITFLVTMITSTVGVFFVLSLIVISAIAGWGSFGSSRKWENSLEDDYLVREETRKEKEEHPELYKEDDINER